MKILFSLLLCVTLIGCSQSGAPRIVKEAKTPTPKIAKDYQDDYYSSNRVLILYGSKNIHKWVNIKDVRMGTSGNLPKMAVTIENRTQSSLPIEYQVTWLDGDGFPLPVSTQAWIRISLPGNADKHIMSLAKMPSAYSAQILVRGAEDIKVLVPLPLKNKDSRKKEIDYQNLYQ